MWKPVPGQMMTRWAKDVTPETAWQEYPRPQMRRRDWMNLNGIWEYAIVPRGQKTAIEMQGQILVPFPIESALSGVKKALGKEDRLWYRRTFTIPSGWQGKRILLHFGAVDWETEVFVNQQKAGQHVGGYLPFSFDITGLLQEGDNELLVAVWDPTDEHWQQRGKQVRNPRTIWYTAVSGIWQTVWLEPVPENAITGLRVTPDVDTGCVHVRVDVSRLPVDVHVQVKTNDRVIADSPVDEISGVSIPIPDPHLWSPDSPFLYDLEVTSGEDRVESYFGMRKFSLEKGQVHLNNQPIFQYGPLDQGYWPDGLYTAPTDEAMRWDIELVKGLGCNMLRKHVKVEPARYYYHCDRLGLIVWQDMPNGGSAVNEIRLFLLNLFGIKRSDRRYKRAGRGAPASRWDFKRELQEMMDHLHHFACIGVWVPFNESWGQFDASAIANWVKAFDPSRLVDHASGWFDQGGGDMESLHIYFHKLRSKKKPNRRALVLSEFGGYSLLLPGHLWNEKEFVIKKFDSREALTAAYLDLLETEVLSWKQNELSAAIYTQTTDVEIEVNGYVTYDREVEKMNFDQIRQVHAKLTAGAGK